MNFTYPLDSGQMLRKKRAIRQSLLKQENLISKRIAVLGGSTTSEIVEQMELFLLHYGIQPEFYQSEYGLYWEDAMFGNERLDAFQPDIVFIHTSWRNITRWPDMKSSKASVNEMLMEQYGRFEMMWEKITERFHCPVIQNNFDRPNWRLLGNQDISDYRGRSRFLFSMNQRLYEYAEHHEQFYINDIDYLAACYGLDQWADPLYWHMYKYALCLDAIPYLSKSVADIIKSIYGKNKKAIAIDLDNTLWGGVIGDDGADGIRIGPEIPAGQVYAEFQKYLKELKELGILLTVNSKNDEKNALAGLSHPDGVLRPDDFVCIKANWENKDKNLMDIADELNLGIDSFVFIDDSPAEREMVAASMPSVAVPVMDKAENYIRILDKSGFFEMTSLSGDDISRTEMYMANKERLKLERTLCNYNEYLKNLEMEAWILPFDSMHMQRIAQLTNKSNQFNLTTLRCSEADIRKMSASSDYLCLYGKLKDKFGDNGVVSIVVGRQTNEELHIELWLMSCRVLQRGMEDAMMDALAESAGARSVKKIIGYYYPTPKNSMVREFYGHMGFQKIKQDEEGNTVWELETASYILKKPPIKVIKQREK